MQDEHIQKIAKAIAEEIRGAELQRHCLCQADCDKHQKDHEFIQGAMEFLSKLNDVRWGVFKAVAIAAVFAFLVSIGFKIKGP